MRVSHLNALKFLEWGGVRMVEEVGQLELADGLPEESFESLEGMEK